VSDPQQLIELFSTAALPCHNEAKMQLAIAELLTEASIPFEREVRLSPRDRIDFLVGSIGIETKISGSYTTVASQLLRYAESKLVSHILLVTTKASHRQLMHLPNENGIPIDVIFTSLYAF
jgi:hypothetical protein